MGFGYIPVGGYRPAPQDVPATVTAGAKPGGALHSVQSADQRRTRMLRPKPAGSATSNAGQRRNILDAMRQEGLGPDVL